MQNVLLSLAGLLLVVSCATNPADTPDLSPKDNTKSPGAVKTADRADNKIGGNWFLIADVSGERAFSVFVDMQSVRTNNQSEVTSVSKLVFPEVQRDEDGLLFKEVQVESIINCAEWTYGFSYSRFYDSLGKIVFQEQVAEYDKGITQDTVSYNIAEFLCKENFPESFDQKVDPKPAAAE